MTLPLQVRLFARLEPRVNRAINALRATHEGIWLGWLDSEDLHSITTLYYARQDQYSDATYNQNGLFGWEERIIESHFCNCRKVIVGACGGGRELLGLIRRGVVCDGFECNVALAEESRKLVAGSECSVMTVAPSTIPRDLCLYDGLVIGWGAYSHIPERARRIDMLRNLRQHLEPQSPFLLSFFARREDSARFRWTAAVGNAIRRARRISARCEVGDRLDGSFDRFFTQKEIRAELDEGGFHLETFHEMPFAHALATAM